MSTAKIEFTDHLMEYQQSLDAFIPCACRLASGERSFRLNERRAVMNVGIR